MKKTFIKFGKHVTQDRFFYFLQPFHHIHFLVEKSNSSIVFHFEYCRKLTFPRDSRNYSTVARVHQKIDNINLTSQFGLQFSALYILILYNIYAAV